ncbi:gastrula zinc finger protein XlCGF53.1-like [Bufo bufo]|uniref:gastrula zinc finger protein XlCGF53.1-like n=1 Tax=Bufo bufo TaxID=8384 RepID=UPI001ABDC894|nr:gastrula zinc finger protein XlCGF53.1-like [Bufo bufo]
MERDRDKMAESIINLTLEILFRLTGEDYTVVKKTSNELCQGPVSEGCGRTLSSITGPPPHPLIHEEINREKILELTNKMIELLTGEVPIRCQDVTIHFSMEEWDSQAAFTSSTGWLLSSSSAAATASPIQTPAHCLDQRHFNLLEFYHSYPGPSVRAA